MSNKYRPNDPLRNDSKYNAYYDKRDAIIKNRNENEVIGDKSWMIIAGIFIAPMFLLILFGMAISTASSNDKIKNKDTFIEIGRNSLGCIQYRYNTDIVWKCPQPQKDITQFERVECTYINKVRSCTKYFDPVVN